LLTSFGTQLQTFLDAMMILQKLHVVASLKSLWVIMIPMYTLIPNIH